MRSAQALDHTTAQVRAAFDADVAEAIVGDAEMFEVASRLLGRHADCPDEIAAVVAQIAADTEDGLADWLVERAESPAGWFYQQITLHT